MRRARSGTSRHRWLYHVVAAETWQEAGESYRPASLVSEGFVHLSAAEQVAGTLRRFFSGQIGLVVLQIDFASIAPQVRWEAPVGVGEGERVETFPHLYGPLPREAVVSVSPANVWSPAAHPQRGSPAQ